MRLTTREFYGYWLLGTVIVVWVLSGFFIQQLFTTSSYNHPVPMTVYSVGLCSILLLVPKDMLRWEKNTPLLLLEEQRAPALTQLKTLLLGFIWLIAQLSYNVSLRYMSVSSNTAVSSLSSIFTCIFSVIFLKNSPVSALSLLAIGISSVGILVIASSQPTSVDGQVNESMTGFFSAGLACCCYGLFTTLLKKFDPNEATSVVDLFGKMGIVALVLGSLLIGLADATGIDRFELPSDPASVIGITLNAIFGSVLSDVLLAKSVLLLNPVTVSVGLSFTMPLSLFLDSVVLKHHQFKIAYGIGMTIQFISVCLISIDNHSRKRDL
jgi:solute carrier family 35 protein F5